MTAREPKMKEEFAVHISDRDLDDLRRRIRFCRRLFMTPSSTQTTGLNVTMGDSRLACGRCAA